MRFVSQAGERFVVKSFVAPGSGDLQAARECVEREERSRAAFVALGVDVLPTALDPADSLDLVIDGRGERFAHVIVYPYRECETLEAKLRGPDCLAVMAEAGRRIAARHAVADDIWGIHSDGAPHNVFADWMWFDFASPHVTTDAALARANEVWRFLCGALALHASLAFDKTLVAAFCEGYGDRHILDRLREDRRGVPVWPRMLAQPVAFIRLLSGNGRQLTRPRAWRALNAWLEGAGVR